MKEIIKTTFQEIMEFYGAHDLEFHAVIGDNDMPATFSFSGTPKFTEYCQEKFGDLLKSQAVVKYNKEENWKSTDVVIVDYPDDEKGEQFTWAWAGYISEKEYHKLFEE